jgi:NADH-quinone oxidoreductase subunit N
MLALAGFPGTSGFMGKLFLIEATVDGDYTWLGVAIVIGTMVSLAYYLRVVAAVWFWPERRTAPPAAEPGAMPAIAGGSPEADAIPRGASRCGLIVGSALLCGAATIAFGVAPSPLIDWASHAAGSLTTTI